MVTFVVTLMLCFGVLWFLTTSYATPLVNELKTLITKVQPALKTDTDTQTDTDQTNRWATNTATVYLEATDAQIQNAYLQALDNWNQTGAFKFEQVTSKNEAQIVLKQQNDSQTKAAGVTHILADQITSRLTSADVYLNTYYLLNPQFGYSNERIVNTAEHELGHAIGLSHNDQSASVMQSAGSYYGIQSEDISAVEKLYQS
ncbi:VirB8/TrbF family protein [Ligilactobacillus apodemi]|nr:VirB8/TrbF family protein [Ligilactobacillus apodemi]